MQESAIMTGLRLYWICMVVRKRDKQLELLPFCTQKTLDWMGHLRDWRAFQHVFNYCVIFAKKVYRRKDFGNYLCLLKVQVVSTVSNAFKKKVVNFYHVSFVSISKDQQQICASTTHFALWANWKKRFEYPMEIPLFSMLESKTRKNYFVKIRSKCFGTMKVSSFQNCLPCFLDIFK